MPGVDHAAPRTQDQHVPRILARQHTAQHDARPHHRLQILQAMHGDIDPPGQHRLVDLLREEPLAADIGQPAARSLAGIAGRGDDVLGGALAA